MMTNIIKNYYELYWINYVQWRVNFSSMLLFELFFFVQKEIIRNSCTFSFVCTFKRINLPCSFLLFLLDSSNFHRSITLYYPRFIHSFLAIYARNQEVFYPCKLIVYCQGLKLVKLSFFIVWESTVCVSFGLQNVKEKAKGYKSVK